MRRLEKHTQIMIEMPGHVEIARSIDSHGRCVV